jgi:hypothetical protein
MPAFWPIQFGLWSNAKIYALVEEMEERLSTSGNLILTAGLKPIAIACPVQRDVSRRPRVNGKLKRN